MSDIFFLDLDYARNYDALQNFLNDRKVVKRRGSAGSAKRKSKIKKLQEQNYKCVDCGFKFHPNKNGVYDTATLDHIIPYRYGSTAAHNSEYVCARCNVDRDDWNYTLIRIKRYFGSIE